MDSCAAPLGEPRPGAPEKHPSQQRWDAFDRADRNTASKPGDNESERRSCRELTRWSTFIVSECCMTDQKIKGLAPQSGKRAFLWCPAKAMSQTSIEDNRRLAFDVCWPRDLGTLYVSLSVASLLLAYKSGRFTKKFMIMHCGTRCYCSSTTQASLLGAKVKCFQQVYEVVAQ